jgi:hypothetical protein
MTGAHQELIPPFPKGGNFLTRVYAIVRLGRGVAGNTTFGLWAIALIVIALGVAFITRGYPEYAIKLLLICAGWYLLYQVISWVGSYFSPDAGVTGDDDYANVIATRQIGAQNNNLVGDELPVVGATGPTVAAAISRHKGGAPV